MKKCIICSIAMFMLASCASQDIGHGNVAESQKTAEKQSEEKKSGKQCKRRSTGQSRAKRC